MQLSFIIPVLNEVKNISALTAEITRLRNAGHEVIVVDGGSEDGTVESLRRCGINAILSAQGRALQMNTGANVAAGEVLVFLHADTKMPENFASLIIQAVTGSPWGRFDVALSGNAMIFRVIAVLMNFRSCLTGIATGDQCIFVKRELFMRVGGYAEIPLMEDICLSKALKKIARPFCIRTRLVTSSRRWETKGIITTVLLMWVLRLAYFFGVSPHRLHSLYVSR